MRFEKKHLVTLLKANKREAFIGKKKTPQCETCIIEAVGTKAVTRNIVKDGVTTLHRLTVPIISKVNDDETIPVASIDDLLGALKHHNCPVHITNNDGKIRVASQNKQTTLISSANAFAYSGARVTIDEQLQKAIEIMARIDLFTLNTYTTLKGEKYSANITITCDTDKLQDALQTNSMNNQNYPTVRLVANGNKLFITTGDEMKGQTMTQIGDDVDGHEFDYEFGGGLDNIPLDYFLGDETKISIFDFHDINGMVVFGFSGISDFFIVLGKRYEHD